jgi:hypothetical protein
MLIRFLSEIAALCILGFWGYRFGGSMLLKWVFAIGTPLLFAVLWGMFGSPKASYPLTGIYKIGFEVAFFTLAAAALYSLNHKASAVCFVIIAVTTGLIIYKYKI